MMMAQESGCAGEGRQRAGGAGPRKRLHLVGAAALVAALVAALAASGCNAPPGSARVVASSEAPEDTMQVVQPQMDRLLMCIPAELRGSGVQLEVQVRVDRSGTFREPRVRSALPDPRIADCIADIFEGMQLPSGEGNGRVVVIPLRLVEGGH